MPYLQISVGEFGWYGIRRMRFMLERPTWETPHREGCWYPVWLLWLGPVIVRWLRQQPYEA